MQSGSGPDGGNYTADTAQGTTDGLFCRKISRNQVVCDSSAVQSVLGLSEAVSCGGCVYLVRKVRAGVSLAQHPFIGWKTCLGRELYDVSGLLPSLPQACGGVWQVYTGEGAVYVS